MFYKQTHTQSPTHKSESNNDYKVRRPKEREMVFGIRAVMEAIDAGKVVDKIIIRNNFGSELAKQLLEKLSGTNTPIQRVPVERLNQYTDKNHQGVIAFLSPIPFQHIEDIILTLYENGKTPFILVLDSITDMRNFGAIARTAECAGVNAIVIPARGGIAINSDAIKTSAGALHTIPICKEQNLQNTLRFLHDSGLKIVAATEHSQCNYTQSDLTGPVAIVLGSEDKGIYSENLKLCDQQVAIPILGNIESLNVSVAAGIMIYEVLRQRNQ